MYFYPFLSTELLEQVHAVGKAGENVFSSAQNFSSSGDSSSPSPAIGFKAQLIRLIGNLCHKHLSNQNKVQMKKTFKCSMIEAPRACVACLVTFKWSFVFVPVYIISLLLTLYQLD